MICYIHMLFWEFKQADYVYVKWFKFANINVQQPNVLALLRLMVNLIETQSSLFIVLSCGKAARRKQPSWHIEVTRKKYENINSPEFEWKK